jgi:hypothetical protein
MKTKQTKKYSYHRQLASKTLKKVDPGQKQQSRGVFPTNWHQKWSNLTVFHD